MGNEKYTVKGHIGHKSHKLLNVVVVSAHHIEFNGKKILGRTKCNEGPYEIEYDPEANGLKYVNLQISFAGPNNKIISSPITYHAKPEEIINISMPNEGPEFKRLSDLLTKYLAIKAFAKLDDKDKEFLINTLDISHTQLEAFIKADQLTRKFKICGKQDAEIYYGLIMSGMDPETNSILEVGSEVLLELFKNAITSGIIDSKRKNDLETIIKNKPDIKAENDKIREEENAGDATDTLEGLLKSINLNNTQKQKFKYLYFKDDSPDTEKIIKELDSNIFKQDAVQHLKFAFDLEKITGRFNPLIASLVKTGKSSINDLFGWDQGAWVRHIKNSGINLPGTYKNRDEIARYAKDIVDRMETMHPAEIFAARIGKEKFEKLKVQAIEEVATFFEKNSTYLNLSWNARQKIVNQQNGDLKNIILQLERLSRITPEIGRVGMVRCLFDNSIRSARDVMVLGRNTFKAQMKETGISEDQLNAIYNRAKHAGIARTIIQQKDLLGKTKPFEVLKPVLQNSDSGDTRKIENALLEQIAGNKDYRECRWGGSVHGPSAYLIDVLYRLGKQPANNAGKTPLDILFDKRPDLKQVKLTCNNTTTPIPYIDLENEVLENSIAQTSFPGQCNWEPEELAAHQEYICNKAYETLAGEDFIFPFDFWMTEAGIYFQHLGVPRYKILSIFRDEKNISNYNVAAEFLGVTDVQFNNLAGENTAGQDNKRMSLADFLKMEEISFSEFRELRRLRWFNKSDIKFFQLSKEPCKAASIDEIEIENTDNALNHFRKVLFIKKSAGWNWREMDHALSTLNSGQKDVDAKFISRLAAIKHMQEDLSLEVMEILSFWGNLEIYTGREGEEKSDYKVLHELRGKYTQYDELFIYGGLHESKNDPFDLVDGEPRAVNDEMYSHIQRIQSAYGISADDLILLIVFLKGKNCDNFSGLKDEKLSLNNLSALYRYIKLSGALNISMRDLLLFIDLCDTDPFTTVSLDSLDSSVEFLGRLRKIRKSKFKIDHFAYLLGFNPTTPVQLEYTGWTLEEVCQFCIQAKEAWKANEESLSMGLRGDGGPEDLKFLEDKLGQYIIDKEGVENLLAIIDLKHDGEEDRDAAFKKLGILGLPVNEIEEKVIKEINKVETVDKNLIINEDNEKEFTEHFINKETVNTRAMRISYLWESVTKPQLLDMLNKASIYQIVADTYNFEINIAQYMIKATDLIQQLKTIAFDQLEVSTEFIANIDRQISSEISSLVRSINLLERMSLIISDLELSIGDIHWLFDEKVPLPENRRISIVDIAREENDDGGISLEKWESFRDLVLLRNKFGKIPGEETDLFSMIDYAGAHGDEDIVSDETEISKTFISNLMRLTSWRIKTDESNQIDPENKFLFLDNNADQAGLKFNKFNKFTDIKTWQTLDLLFSFSDRLGTDIKDLFNWSTVICYASDNTEGENQALFDMASKVKELARSKYSRSQWQEIARPLRDQLREKQRDALVDYYLRNKANEKIKDRADLYDHLMLDMDMSPCQMTSRVKQASLTVQLFVQRCLMNLEPDVHLTKKMAVDWQWMKQYRVWEANRKIFMYPENWLHPELRRNKTPLFEKLENELMQNQLDEDKAISALKDYVYGLNEIAFLETCAIYNDYDNGEPHTKPDVHMIARTKSQPHKYFYRTFVHSDYWTPWQSMDLDIGDVENNHMLLFIYKKTLHFFWLVLTEKEKRQSVQESKNQGDPANEPTKILEVRVAHAMKEKKTWVLKGFSDLSSFEDYDPSALSLLILDASNTDSNQLKLKINVCSTWTTIYSGISGERPIQYNAVFYLDCFGDLRQEENVPFTSISSIEYSQREMRMYSYRNRSFFCHNNTGVPSVLMQIPNLPFVTKDSNSYCIDLLDHAYCHKSLTLSDQKHSFYSICREIRTTGFILSLWYDFYLNYHPYTTELLEAASQNCANDLLSSDLQAKKTDNFFNISLSQNDPGWDNLHNFAPTGWVTNEPKEKVDFDLGGTYEQYNWELFFHIPFLIAERFRQNKKFEEAEKWYHYIFNPSLAVNDDASQIDETSMRFWNTLPLRQDLSSENIQALLGMLEGDLSSDLAERVRREAKTWMDNPFDPHAIARIRLAAYQKRVVMSYLENLIEWGDELFRQDTMESLNIAMLCYHRAGSIMGRRPEKLPAKETVPKSVESILNLENDADLQDETFVDPGDSGTGSNIDDDVLKAIPPWFTTYFCLPFNDQLVSYWNTLEDRLFKLRHCMNIEGIERQLPLFQPPIDPGLIAAALASGVSIADAVNAVAAGAAPRPHYRFNFMLQKALELANELKSLGSALLAALEKKDGESLSLLRSKHEIKLLEAAKDIRKEQVKEAKEALKGIELAKDIVAYQYEYYSSREFMNPCEKASFSLAAASGLSQVAAQIAHSTASAAVMWPDFIFGGAGMSSPVGLTIYPGGTKIAASGQGTAKALEVASSLSNTAAQMAGTIGSYQRRSDDWEFQAKRTKKELKQYDKQILSAKIRLAVAELELRNLEKQIDQAKETYKLMHAKFTNKELYQWMTQQISRMHTDVYYIAYDLAKRAERCYQHELGVEPSEGIFIKAEYRDSLKKSLLSGEKLSVDLRRMESAYYSNNRRELELRKKISMAKDLSAELNTLKTGESCTFSLGENLFDSDGAGQYFRRIKNVRITIPCVVGPYTNVNATLTLLSSAIRIKPESPNKELEIGMEEAWAKSYYGATEMIATSHGNNDSGLFEMNFRDERYLPFEGSGVVSQWKLDLPRKTNSFNFNDLSDVIIHIDFTARYGGDTFRDCVVNNLP